MTRVTPNKDWLKLWEERRQAVERVLGGTTPPGEVLPFSWQCYTLPGACALTFAPCETRDDWLYMTLGLTQPVQWGCESSPWEFCVRTRETAPWAHQLLYDLTTYYLSQQGEVERGLYLPLVFFSDRSNRLCVGLTDDTSGLSVVGKMSGLYLWDDQRHLRFDVSSGAFGLLGALGVRPEEDELAQETTPPHLILLFTELGIDHSLDPHRESVTQIAGFQDRWETIRELSHEDVISRLERVTTSRKAR